MTVETFVDKQGSQHTSFESPQREPPHKPPESISPIRRAGPIKLIISIGLLGTVTGALAVNFSLAEIRSDLVQLPPLVLCAVFTTLLANALAATFRFRTIATEIGHSISFRAALATVSTSNLAGALFFQIAGQLIARGVIAGRGGIPFPAVIVITAYERIPAAILSAILASGGAFFIFGNIYLDRSAGGAELLKIVAGLTAAATVGALLGYGRMAVQTVAPLLNRHFVRQCLTLTGLALLVQLPMQAAYVLAAHTLSPQTPIPDLVAASAIVMFATSVPISLAGWGIREMSAIVGLGAIGVPAHAALTAAITIGVGSLLVVGIFAMLSLFHSTAKARTAQTLHVNPIDYERVLAWVLPTGAAVLVLFQIYVPLEQGLLNVNLADPIVLVGGSLLILSACRQREMPRWRASIVNAAVAITTFVLACSLLIGSWRFGWTSWVWVNRFLGWFVLLSYGATGAFAVANNGKNALRIVLLTFVGATAAVAAMEIGLLLLHAFGIQLSSNLISLGAIEGFSQNRNSFALQILLAMCAAISFARGFSLRITLLAVFLAALWFAGSRSGWIAGASVFGVNFYFRKSSGRESLIAVTCAVSIALIVWGLQTMDLGPAIIPTASSTQERLASIFGHPVFDAGLGAFYGQLIPSPSGSPLVIHSTPAWLPAELVFMVFAVPLLHIVSAEARSATHDQVSAFIVMCVAAFVVMCIPRDMLYERTFWFVIGAALALRTRVAMPESNAVPIKAHAPG